jgi:hypothetical protein
MLRNESATAVRRVIDGKRNLPWELARVCIAAIGITTAIGVHFGFSIVI